jgi:RNA-directed DNA polymerase
MQTKLYQASLAGNTVDARKIQKMIIRSEAARFKAVRTVTQDNRGGKRTAGIEGIKLLSPKKRVSLAEKLTLDGKASPTLEVSSIILKNNKMDGSPRMLGIEDRAKQALARLALEPI